MEKPGFKSLSSYRKLEKHLRDTSDADLDLKSLVDQENRFHQFTLRSDSFFYDFSKQKITPLVFNTLIELAEETRARQKFSDMVNAEQVNITEKRAALHTWTRMFSDSQFNSLGKDTFRSIQQVNDQIKTFVQKIHTCDITNANGKRFTDAVVVGIGGSYLGCEFVYTALKNSFTPKINLHFLPNVDIDQFGQVIQNIIPENTLWIVISKSYTTTETMANLEQVKLYLKSNQTDVRTHLITITSKGSPGDDPSNPVLSSFHMFDFIGGRYSVSSAVGGLPLSLAFGYDIFERFLKGCNLMDLHALNTPESKNIPLISALISIWNTNFLGYTSQAIIPYSSGLSKLAPHVQQLYMESLGKGVTEQGYPIDYKSGVLIFGEPGTNAQHSFFQLAHQGMAFPIEFIGILNPVYNKTQATSKGVYNHQELWANMLAQARALAVGKKDPDSAKICEGNRPSSTIVLNDLTPENIGQLLSFYEARTVFEGFILDVNPFDQFGVELGKLLASDIRTQMAEKNKNAGHDFETDPATKWYLETLFRGEL